MPECVFYAFREGMRGMKRASEVDQLFVQLFSQRLRFLTPDSQPVCRRLVLDLSFDVVQLPVSFQIASVCSLSPRYWVASLRLSNSALSAAG